MKTVNTDKSVQREFCIHGKTVHHVKYEFKVINRSLMNE